VVQSNVGTIQPLEAKAYEDPYPSGPNAQGVVLDDREERWTDPIAASIAARTSRPADQLVVLTTDYSLMSFEPYRGFQQITPHYANPLSDYRDREAFVERWAATRDPAAARALLAGAPWQAPTVVVAGRLPDGLHVRLGRDAFPADPNIVFDDVVFDPQAFAGWSSEDVGPYTVLVAPGA
jgi:galactan 5-O-arabinofuranosyltransferase